MSPEQQILNRFSDIGQQLQDKIVTFLPNILVAVSIFLLGLGTAYLIRTLVTRFIARLDKIFPIKSGAQSFSKIQFSELLAKLVFWIILFFFLTVATEIVGLKVVTTWLGGLTSYLPRLLAATLIAGVGFIAGAILRDMVEKAATSAGLQYSAVLGKLVQVSLIVITLVVVAGQIGVDTQFLSMVSMILLGTLLGAMALAFGLGSKDVVGNILSSHYLQKRYFVGNRIKMGSVTGQITEISPVSVTVETRDGFVTIPAKEFMESSSTLIRKSK